MNCYIHAQNDAVGMCTTCGKPICSDCAVEVQGKLTCRTCLANNRGPSNTGSKDANTAFLLELVGGFLGLLGLGYLYVGKTSDGVIRLIGWIVYDMIAFVTISLLLAVFIGIICIPIQLIIQ